MQPVVTPAEKGVIDAAAPEPVDVLIDRAGAAVARTARRMLGGTYGRRVVVVAGKGNNGADGRAAAARLREAGVRTVEVDAADPPPTLPPCDLVIDAAYGTGFRGSYEAPALTGPRPPVLAVDIPSGVSGLTGAASGSPMAADETVSFAAWKPGLLWGAGPELAGDVEVVDIGLDTSSATAHLLEPSDVAAWLPARPRESHKWKSAVWVVAGSAGMTGAAHLAARAAMRAGAGYVRLSSPGLADDGRRPIEAVGHDIAATGWSSDVIAQIDRFRALVVGPGLGVGDDVTTDVRALVAGATVSTLVDGDGLTALGAAAADTIARRNPEAGAVVLTPHDGEFARLAGDAPSEDRIGAARGLAAATGAVVLLKGSTTVVAHPDGQALVVCAGDARLATAGTGDVLSGVIGALLARGLPGFEAAAAGAWLHGRAARHGPSEGLVASDLPDLVPAVLAELAELTEPVAPVGRVGMVGNR
jgi:NAD(P)H-hydrate epimerase